MIAEQIEKFWEQYGERYVPNLDLPKAVIFDIDGTLAHTNGKRGIYEWASVHLDDPDELVIAVARGLKAQGLKIVIVSGRDGECEEVTLAWLNQHLGFAPDDFFIRGSRDGRRDSIVKKEIFNRDIAPKYHVIGVVDDRPVVVRMWRSLGLQTLACGFQSREF